MRDIEVVADAIALARTAAGRITAIVDASIAARGRCRVALSGGSTPEATYRLLATEEFARQVEWSSVEVFWTDERCVPPDHARSNYRMAQQALLDRVPIPPANVHRMRGEDDPHMAAAAYGEVLRRAFGVTDVNAPPVRFDLVLLGMGEDGHTASMFPGQRAVQELTRWVIAERVQPLGEWRITLTPAVLNAAAHLLFLVEGEGKGDTLRRVVEGPAEPIALPAQIMHPRDGQTTWLVDAAAASRLSRS